MSRDISQWTEIFGRLDATHRSAESAIADRIIADLFGYQHRSKYRPHDAEQLATALQAYAKMLQDAGVTVT